MAKKPKKYCVGCGVPIHKDLSHCPFCGEIWRKPKSRSIFQ